MKFNEVLNRYLEELDCTAKKLPDQIRINK